MSDALAALRVEVQTASRDELPAIIGQIAAIEAEAFARIVSAPRSHADDVDDRLIDAEEAAKLLGQTPRWVRDHAHKLPRVALPGRSLRFSERRLLAMIVPLNRFV